MAAARRIGAKPDYRSSQVERLSRPPSARTRAGSPSCRGTRHIEDALAAELPGSPRRRAHGVEDALVFAARPSGRQPCKGDEEPKALPGDHDGRCSWGELLARIVLDLPRHSRLPLSCVLRNEERSGGGNEALEVAGR